MEGCANVNYSQDYLNGRVAIVTGAGSGIGRAIAHRVAAVGASVIVADREIDTGVDTANSITSAGETARFVACDVAESASVQHLMKEAMREFGRLDILVNNAGIPGPSAPADRYSDEDWDRVIAVNLGGVFRCSKYAIPHLEASGYGAIVNIASTFGMIGAPESPAYCAAKGGVINLTRQLAVDLGARGIRVNAVSPGYVDNDMARRGEQMPLDEAAARWASREAAAALQPLGRQCSTDEIASVVTFLVGDGASFMTGAIVAVDGGCTATFNRGSRLGR
jgi:NAD(P)-dependent dehydrogenase (short-subunit alcohol dehydrogenase family)